MTTSASSTSCDIADATLADDGDRLISWAAREMPVLGLYPRAFREGAAARGPAPRSLPARHQRNGQPRHRS